jgi:DNA-binding HxlR family transcriptional regulator
LLSGRAIEEQKSVLAAAVPATILENVGRGYGEYCPIAKASEILAERWTPLIVRNISLRSHSFSEIHRGIPRVSSTLLAQRLRALERAGVIERVAAPTGHGSRYYLTSAGQELAEVVLQMGTWGARWLDLAPDDYDVSVVLWAWAKFVEVDRLPPQRVVVRFDISDDANKRYWMLLERPEPEVCVKHPGFDEDLIVATDSVTLTNVHRGRLDFGQAMKSGRLTLSGQADIARAFPTWGGRSRFADVQPARPWPAGPVKRSRR